MHWVVLKRSNKKKGKYFEFFDSYDLPLNYLPSKWARACYKSDDCVFQEKNSKVCGQYCALYLCNTKIMQIFSCASNNPIIQRENDNKCLYLFNKLK